MTSTPHDPYGSDEPDVVDLGAPEGTVLPERTTPRGGRRRAGLLVGGVLALAVAGGAGAYAVSALGGGGDQPEVAVPSSAFALVRVDLDPAAGQKLDALRFARRFPDVGSKLGSGDDPRQAIFEALTKDSTLSADYARDVEPWLGQRAALAVVPGVLPEDDPVPLVVLAVTDAGAARTGLAKVVGAGRCVVSGDFAVCAEDGGLAQRAVTAAGRSSLADDAGFTDAVAANGEDGVALAWADLAKAKSALPALASALRSSGGRAGALGSLAGGGDPKGRFVAAVRFDGPNLEVAGRVDGASLPAASGASGVGDLPAGTLVALGTGGADGIVGSAWTQLRTALVAQGGAEVLDDEVAAVQKQYGVTLPGDLIAALGSRATVAFGGVTDGEPDLAVRTSGRPQSVATLVAAFTRLSGSYTPSTVAAPTGLTLSTARAGSDTVVASSKAYADKVAAGSGLGATTVFTDAVPGFKDAQQVVFVDVAGLVALAEGSLGADAAAVRNLEPISAVGLTGSRDGSAATFDLRLTTR
ncbi:MAG: DUF3352 domain-containing protein [Actinomycetota bacterium]